MVLHPGQAPARNGNKNLGRGKAFGCGRTERRVEFEKRGYLKCGEWEKRERTPRGARKQRWEDAIGS